MPDHSYAATPLLSGAVVHRWTVASPRAVVVLQHGFGEYAERYVAGYTCGHDVSARDYQLKRGGGQWMVGKTGTLLHPWGRSW